MKRKENQKIMKAIYTLIIAASLMLATSEAISQKVNSTPLKAGAAKVDVTPAPADLPKSGFKLGIRDHLNVRAIVVDNGSASAAFISVDVSTVPEYLYWRYIGIIEKETGIPAGNIVISPSHTHASIRLPQENAKNIDPAIAKFTDRFEKSLAEVVKKAKSNLRPALVSYNTGESYLNVNRDVIDPDTRLWSQAPDYDGPSDHEVAVVTFRTLEGEPFAVYYNFGMHSNYMYMSGVLSAGVPGETCRYIEEYYNDKVVALWSMSASGDQNPRYLQPMQDVERLKSQAALASGRAGNTGEANSVAGAGGVDDIIDLDPALLKRQSDMAAAIGKLMAEEVLRTIKYSRRSRSQVRIFVADTTVTCPGRIRTNEGREGEPGTYADGDPVEFRLKLIVLGDIAYCIINGDAYSNIARGLKEEAPYNFTIMVAHSNGRSNSGYIPTDDAFGRNTFQVLNSSLYPGCAERAIINGFLDLMELALK
jgi:hypothetical protein